MATKTKIARWELEVEKYRSEGNWGRVLDTVRQISSRSTVVEILSTFVHAECALERHLLEHPANVIKARDELGDTYQALLDVYHMEDTKNSMKVECTLLIAKLQYAQGDYQAALNRIEKANIDDISLDNASNRRLKIVSEAYAIKGLCLEHLPLTSTSKYKQHERESQKLACFEKAGDLALLQLQKLCDIGKDSSSASAGISVPLFSASESDSQNVGPIIETALQRSPMLYIRQGELKKGIGRFRELLQAVETRAVQNVRQILARQLAEVLMRGVCPSTYNLMDAPTSPGFMGSAPPFYPGSTGSLTRANSPPHGSSKHPISPHKPKKYSGKGHKQRHQESRSLFVPKNHTEEVILLLLISESMATRNAVLSRSIELEDIRVKTFEASVAVYDLLTIQLVRRAQFSILSDTFDIAMKTSFDEFHTWYQFGLSLICSEKYQRAYLVMLQCVTLQPTNPTPMLHIAQLCYENLHQYNEGIEYAERVIELEGHNPFIGRAYIYQGVGYSLLAEQSRLQHDRQNYQKQALNAFINAQTTDPSDHLAEFHIAYQRAMLRQIPESLKHVKRALFLHPDHLASLHLLALLLSAQSRNNEALDLLNAAVAEYPDNFSLLFTKSHLEEAAYGNSLSTCKRLLRLWRTTYEPNTEHSQESRSCILGLSAPRSLAQLQLGEFSDRESAGSLHTDSIAASRMEHALSEVASSINSSGTPGARAGSQTWLLQLQIWLHLAEVYLNMGSLDECHACIQEAGNIYPISHLVSYMRGRFHELRGDFSEAKCCYQNAVSINPAHVPSLQHLGQVLHNLECDRLAEKVLRDAVTMDPMSCETWRILGNVLESVGEYAAAAECLATVVSLEATEPIVPFTVVHKVLH